MLGQDGYLLCFPALVPARFVSRPHRFAALCTLESTGELVEAHTADPGRLREILVPGARLWLEGPFGPPRKLPYSVWLAEHQGVFVTLVTTLANRLFPSLIAHGLWPELTLPQEATLRAEVTHGESRVDFLRQIPHRPDHWIEVKSVTLARPGEGGAFPDAPSLRARRHVRGLISLVEQGAEASLVFVAGREDVSWIEAASEVDPEFARLLPEALRAGVQVLGCAVTLDTRGAHSPRRVPVV